MKTTLINLALAATLAAAQPHNNHYHGRFHQKRDVSPVENPDKPGGVVTTVVAATETAYVMGDKPVTPEEAKAGIDKGLYIVVGESTPTFVPPPPPTPSPTTSSAKKMFAQFIEKPTSTTTPAPKPTTTPPAAPPPPKSTDSGSSSGGGGLNAPFPDGKLPCEWSSLEKYGAVAIPWMKMDGFAGIQKVSGFKLGMAISNIATGISGDGCDNGDFCSYSCPNGYVKTQWPEEQGATGQSIGGLHCRDNKLWLTRPSAKTLCEQNAGALTIKNSLQEGVAVCRTDYPGTENMIIPTWSNPGSTVPLANIKSSNYYTWGGKATSLQYYINPQGVSVENACVWTSPTNPDSAGNWAPTNLGVSESTDGNNYLSIFPNLPTSHAKLNFNIRITGDVTKKCTLVDGQYYSDGQSSPSGCTTVFKPGANVVIEFY